ncbi:copper resistance protein B [Sphingomonas sp. Y38-1Y]|uniref:copper resistance protein B n=1 Tax=Sphingomonas sp. Y38-1Y TaxID=3078265 RepID=UPI0028EECF62|nr:copper resistance protein B [Sphingomonas sp. Y38-1Y]
MTMLILAAMLAATPQHQGHAAPACTPEHAAMGHCKPAPAKPVARAKPKASPARAVSSRKPKRSAPPARKAPAAPKAMPELRPAAPVPACAPEHAAIGHCTIPPAAPSATSCSPEQGAMGHCKTAEPVTKPADPACPPEHAAMGHCKPTAAPAIGNAPAPAAFPGLAASSFYGEDAMTRASDALRREHGGMAFNQIMLNIAEVAVRSGRDGYRWDGEAWFGGDINRLVVKSEGEGAFGDRLDDAEIQLLYARAVGPYENLQFGLRQDLGAGARRTYVSAGFEALAPYWFDVEGTLFLSDKGELFARGEAYVDQRLTNWWVLQPRAEFDLSAQDVPALRLGSGLTKAELGLRLRYEWKREVAPYVGVSWERRFGDTARYARAMGEETGGFVLVAGVRAWF